MTQVRYFTHPRLVLRSLFVIATLLICAFSMAEKPQLFAVLVGLGKYDIQTQGFGELHGANDVRRMHEFLSTHVDAQSPKNIWDLTKPEETTKAAIVKTVKEKLIDNPNIHSGDIVVLYYSGHGDQVVIDGKIKQAIIPIDVKRVGGPEGEIVADSTIAGPEVGGWIKSLLPKTRNVTFVFDSCHSATISRGSAIPKAGYPNPAVNNGQADPIQKDTSIGSAVVISAANVDESAWESNGNGNLTTALLKAATFLTKDREGGVLSDKSSVTYDDVKKRLDMEILTCDNGYLQHPQIQGSELRRQFLGGSILNPPVHMDVAYQGGVLLVDGGELRGLTPGVIVGLYPRNTTDFTRPTATASVTRLSGGRAILEVQGKTDASTFDGMWAIVVDGSPSGEVNVCMDDLKTNPKYDSIVKKLEALKFVRVGTLTDYDCRITPPDADPVVPKGAAKFEIPHTAGMWTVSNSAGSELATLPPQESEEDLLVALQDQIINASRYKAVKALSPSGMQPYRIEAKLVRVRTSGPKDDEIVTAVEGPIAQPTEARDEGRFAIMVRATGPTGRATSLESYIAVLDLTPNRKVLQAWPDIPFDDVDKNSKLKVDGNWYFLGTRGSYVPTNAKGTPIDVKQVYAWYFNPKVDGEGEEMFKVLGTDVPQNYSDLLTRSVAMGSRGAETELASLLKKYSTGQVVTRSGRATRGVSSFSMGTVSADIRVGR